MRAGLFATTSLLPDATLAAAAESLWGARSGVARSYLGEISEVPRHGQVQLLRVVVSEDPGKDGVLVQVVVRPP